MAERIGTTDLRLGIDVGGTFTDFVVVDGGQTRVLKVPTDPVEPSKGVLAGVVELAQQHDVQLGAVTHFVHGTTLALNTLLQRSGATVGLLVTQGFEDLLEIGRGRLPIPNNIYADKYPSLVARTHVRGIGERLRHDGAVLTTLRDEEVIQAARELVAAGAQALAICFLYSFRDPAHEQRAREVIQAALPGLFVCASSDLLRQQREYERAMVASINAHVGQKMATYFSQLSDRLAEQGLVATVFSTKSNGGVMTGRNAAERPVETLLSGPAAGVVGATYMGRLAGHPRLITLDIGGTSADVAIIDEEFGYTIEARIGDFPIMVPTVEISSIGAGGGSIAWIDAHGVLKVGPESAGSRPGPACYGQGGALPTVTDAYLLNGWLDPEHFIGGKLRLYPALAEQALANLGRAIGLTAVETARAIITVATSNMYAQLVPLLARSGVDPTEFALLTFGGAGPTHGFLLAREVGISTVVVPPAPGILCAFGCLVADLRADFVQTLLAPAATLAPGALEIQFGQMEAEAHAWLKAQRAAVESVRLTRFADMRYVGQSFEITVPLNEVPLAEPGLARLHHQFDEVYRQAYKTSDTEVPIEIVNLRVQIIGHTPKPELTPLPRRNGNSAAPTGVPRMIYLDEEQVAAKVYARAALRPGDRVSGPCIIEQYDTTSVIPPGCEVTVDEWGNLIARFEPEEPTNHA